MVHLNGELGFDNGVAGGGHGAPQIFQGNLQPLDFVNDLFVFQGIKGPGRGQNAVQDFTGPA